MIAQKCRMIKDGNFFKLETIILSILSPKFQKIDVLFIDTLHEANHVKNLFYQYYNLIKPNGFIFIDDISHLPYLKNAVRNNFYCK